MEDLARGTGVPANRSLAGAGGDAPAGPGRKAAHGQPVLATGGTAGYDGSGTDERPMKQFHFLVRRAAMLAAWVAVFAFRAACAGPEPVFLEVKAGEIVVYEPPFHPFAVTEVSSRLPGNDFEKFLEWVSARRDTRCLVLLVRPSGVSFHRAVRRLAEIRDLAVVDEPWGEDEPVSFAPDGALAGFQGELPAGAKAGDDLRPAFFECRGNGLFPIPLEGLRDEVDAVSKRLAAETEGDQATYLRQAAQTAIETEGFRMDYASAAMMGRFILTPDLDAEGHPVAPSGETAGGGWFAAQLATLDPAERFLCFMVRPDGISAFREARALAREKGFDVVAEMQQRSNPLVFGDPSGRRIRGP